MHKRSLTIHGHRTSVLLEVVFWDALEEIAAEKNLTLPALISHIDRRRIAHAGEGREKLTSLASALRVYVVGRLQAALTACPERPHTSVP